MMRNLYFHKLQQHDFQISHSIYRIADSWKRAISLHPCQYWILLNAFFFFFANLLCKLWILWLWVVVVWGHHFISVTTTETGHLFTGQAIKIISINWQFLLWIISMALKYLKLFFVDLWILKELIFTYDMHKKYFLPTNCLCLILIKILFYKVVLNFYIKSCQKNILGFL